MCVGNPLASHNGTSWRMWNALITVTKMIETGGMGDRLVGLRMDQLWFSVTYVRDVCRLFVTSALHVWTNHAKEDPVLVSKGVDCNDVL